MAQLKLLLTCNYIGISVSILVIRLLRFLSCKLIQTACRSDLLIFLGKPYFLIHMKIKHMFGEKMNRN